MFAQAFRMLGGRPQSAGLHLPADLLSLAMGVLDGPVRPEGTM
jgi:hypothetical protein